MRNLCLWTLVALLMCSCVRTSLKGRDLPPVTESHVDVTTAYFKNVEMTGSLDVVYEQSNRNYVRFEGPASAMKHYGMEVKGETLYLSPRNGSFRFGEDDDVRFVIGSTDLVGVSVAGSGDFLIRGTLDTDRLRMRVAGSGDIKADDIVCDAVEVDIAGSGEIDLKRVTTGTAHFSVVGSGDLEANFAQCRQVTAKVAGSGDIKLSGRADSFKTDIAGSGDIDVVDLVTK